MEKKPLTAVVVSPPNLDFDEQFRTLTVNEDQDFTIGIKEYEEEFKKINDALTKLNNEKISIPKEAKIDREILELNAKDRYKKDPAFQKLEMHNGKMVSHAQVSLDANIENSYKKESRQLADVQKQIDALNAKLAKLNEDYKDVVWVWEIAQKRSVMPISSNSKLGEGNKRVSLVISPSLYGGGFARVEPFFKSLKPTGNTKNQILVHTTGGEPDVVAVQWYGFDKNKNPVEISWAVAPMTKVQLHIYTKSLYGVNIKVELKANGKTLKANSYHYVTYIKTAKEGEKTKDREMKRQLEESKDLFYTEVDVYELSSMQGIRPPGDAVFGSLLGENDTSIQNVQKAVLDFYIDPAWCLGDPNLVIIPTIHYSGKAKTITEASLKVDGTQFPEMQMPDTGNKPVFVDKVETSKKAFHLCRYTYFKVNDGSREVDLIEDKSIDPLNVFELVAGEANNTTDITLSLDPNTKDCSFEGTDKDHMSHVINIQSIKESTPEKTGKFISIKH